MEELENGIVKRETKETFIDIVQAMMEEKRIEGLILGCTELPMILDETNVTILLLNTMEINVDKMVEYI